MTHESLPARLRVLRARQGLTLIEAAEKLGIGRDTLSDLERGNRRPVMPTLAKIAKGYGVPVEDLLEEPVPLGEVPEVGPSKVQTPEGATEAEVERRAIYLRVALEEIRDKAENARWALEEVPSFSKAEGDIKPEQMLESWGHFIGELRDDVHHKARRWRAALTEISGHEMPTWERALADEIRYQLERYEEIVEKLRARFNDEWQSFQQRLGKQLALVPKIHQPRPRQGPEEDAMPAAADELPGSRPSEEAGEAS
jgi:transcriptional regulator with XRE-family HTH domain